MKRVEFRLNSKALLGAIILAAAGATPVQAATIAVNAFEDAEGIIGCSLREAVIAMNTGAVGDTGCVNTAADGFGTNDTITLPAGTYNLSVTGLDEGWTGAGTEQDPYRTTNVPDATKGDIDILKSVRIVGAGAGLTTIQWDPAVAAESRDRIFHVYTDAVPANQAPPIEVAIEGVTLQGGRTSQQFIAEGPDNPDSQANVPTEYWLRRAGGALAVGLGAVVVQIDPALEGSDNSIGSGGSQRPDDSGNPTYEYELTLVDVKVQDNYAGGDGGGVSTGYPMTANGVVISGNTSETNGGGLYNEGVTSIVNSTISDNVAEGGGGMFLTGISGPNAVTIRGSTISGNYAIGGAGISGRAGVTINIVNSTISSNTGKDVGAGLYHQGPANLNFVTIANNVAGTKTGGSGINVFPSGGNPEPVMTLKNVLLANNKVEWVDGMTEAEIAALPTANCGQTGGGITVTSLGNNLSSDTSCDVAVNWLIQNTDQNDVDPKLEPLADNGGATLTHALAADSPALSAGVSDPDVKTDQRGEPRESPPDIGAFEVDNITESNGGGGGGGCAVGGNGRIDPTMPALFAAALAFFGLRRRGGK